MAKRMVGSQPAKLGDLGGVLSHQAPAISFDKGEPNKRVRFDQSSQQRQLCPAHCLSSKPSSEME